MRVVFIDETENSNLLKGFYGVCAVALDSSFYTAVRESIEKALRDAGWCTDHEFKGTTLFSSTSGDTTVSIDDRIDAASSILEATVSTTNARCKCAFAWTSSGPTTANHLDLVDKSIRTALTKAPNKTRDKNVVVVYADEKQSVPTAQLSATVKAAVAAKGYVLLEDVNVVHSSCETPGVLLADIVAYLSMWIYSGHKAASARASLFDETLGVIPKHLEKKLKAVEVILEGGSGVTFVPALK